jgi:CheY-like chemotaxis protein
LAEDSLVNQKLAVALLKRHGHDVTIANNGREVLAALESQQFDAVLMDVQMPDLDGLETTAAIRSREMKTEEHIPIIAMTAHAMRGDRERCLTAGMDDYIAKPIRSAQLFETLARVMHRSESSEDDMATKTETQGDYVDPSGNEASPRTDWNRALRHMKDDPGLTQVVIEALLEEAPRLTAEIHGAVPNRDFSTIRRAAHTLKGSFRYFGENPAFQRALELEMAARDESFEKMPALVEELDNEVTRLIPAIHQYLDNLETAGTANNGQS